MKFSPSQSLYLPLNRWVNTIASLVFAAMAIAPSVGTGVDAGGVGLGVVFIAVAIRTAISGITLREDQLVIRNIFTTWRIPRPAVRSAKVGHVRALGGIRAVVIETHSGKRRSCTNLSPGSLQSNNARVERDVELIESWSAAKPGSTA